MKIIIAVRISFSDNLAFQTINIDGISDLMIIISRKTARCIMCFAPPISVVVSFVINALIIC